MTKQANAAAIAGVKDMQRGLHMVMDELIKEKNCDRAEIILHQLDSVMLEWLNTTKEL